MYHIVYGILYGLSLLPLRVLYLLSDFAFVVVYHLMGYRKEVVLQNLAIAFPAKSDAERNRIARQFYRNFCDNFIETIKLFSASDRFLDRHFTGDVSLFQRIYADGKKCQVHMGHNFNWELGNVSISRLIPHTLLGVYMPIENKVFDRIFRKLRAKSGTGLLPANDMRRAMLPWRDQLYALGLVADQNPSDARKGIWVSFFGKPAPFVMGPENGARAGNLPVIFCHITKKKRGYYEGHFTLAEEFPANLPKGELTRRYILFLEQVIAEQPEMWLWSHRRWKHQWQPEFGLLDPHQPVADTSLS